MSRFKSEAVRKTTFFYTCSFIYNHCYSHAKILYLGILFIAKGKFYRVLFSPYFILAASGLPTTQIQSECHSESSFSLHDKSDRNDVPYEEIKNNVDQSISLSGPSKGNTTLEIENAEVKNVIVQNGKFVDGNSRRINENVSNRLL